MSSRVRVFGALFLAAIPFFFFQNCSRQHKSGGDGLQSNSSLEAQFANKEILAQMKNADADATFREWALAFGLELEGEWTDRNLTHWSWEADLTVQELMDEALGQDFSDQIDFVEPNFILSAPVDLPDRPLEADAAAVAALSFNLTQLDQFSSASKNETIHGNIGVDELQGTGDQGEPIIVAVIDSGLDVSHGFFSASNSLWTNPGEIPGDGIDNDGNGRVDDVNGWNFINESSDLSDDDGHGTHCAGTVLNVAVDMFGNPMDSSPIKVMGLKFIGSTGGKTSDAIKAIDYAVQMGARVLSNSWGGPSPSQALEGSIINASNRGLVIAVAAGNSSANNDVVGAFPANISAPNVISVAAADSSDNLASFSNFGVNKVHLAAPGVRVLSTYPREGGEDQYNFLSGTSMATPYVAGTAAMMLNANPGLSGFDVKTMILNQADRQASLNNFLISRSRLNAKDAVDSARGFTGVSQQPQEEGGQFSSLANANSDSGGGGGCGTVAVSGSGGPPPAGPVALLLLPLMLMGWFRHSYNS